MAQVKALACELPAKHGLPLSRYSTSEIARQVLDQGLTERVSFSSVWRWLNEDAIRPWRHRMWLFPRDPDFEEKAARVLDLYHGIWQGQPLEPNEYVLCADEKTSIQARRRMADPYLQQETIPSLSSTNMNAKVRWLILQLGMCIAPKCLDDVRPKRALRPSIGS